MPTPLTDDLLKQILQFLDVKAVCQTSSASKQFNRVKKSLLAEINVKMAARHQNNSLLFFLENNSPHNLILLMPENQAILGALNAETLGVFLLNLPEAYLKKALQHPSIVNLMNTRLLKKIIDNNPTLIEFVLLQQNLVTLADTDLLYDMITSQPRYTTLLWKNPNSELLKKIDDLIMFCMNDQKTECLSYFANSNNSTIKKIYDNYASLMNPSLKI